MQDKSICWINHQSRTALPLRLCKLALIFGYLYYENSHISFKYL